MKWNAGSDILALLLMRPGTQNDSASKCVIQLWHSSNYTWFLKKELHFDSGSDEGGNNGTGLVADFAWDQENKSLFRVMTTSK
jgi:hypothetical protein